MLAFMCLKNATKMWLFGLKKSPKFVNFTIICIIWLLKNEKRGKIIKTNIMRPFTCKRTEKKLLRECFKTVNFFDFSIQKTFK